MALVPGRPTLANRDLSCKCLKVLNLKPKDNQSLTAN